MAEWLGDTPIFQQAMTSAERDEFERFKTEVKAIDTKETDMAKKNENQTTIDLNENVNTESKEDTTMTENTATNVNANEKENTTMTKYNYREDKARHAEIRENAKLGRTKAVEVTSCLPGHTTANFTNDPAEVELLGKAAAKFGMGTEFCTVSQAKKFGGELDPDYKGHGWLIKYKPVTAKSGKNAGKTTQFETVVYPKGAFVWNTESGEPEFDEQAEAERAAKRAKRAANRAAKALKAANAAAGIKPKRKATRRTAKKVTINEQPTPLTGPAKLIHIKLANGIEFDARDAKEAAELKALFA